MEIIETSEQGPLTYDVRFMVLTSLVTCTISQLIHSIIPVPTQLTPTIPNAGNKSQINKRRLDPDSTQLLHWLAARPARPSTRLDRAPFRLAPSKG